MISNIIEKFRYKITYIIRTWYLIRLHSLIGLLSFSIKFIVFRLVVSYYDEVLLHKNSGFLDDNKKQ
jgi:hypothetical protein